MTTQTATPGELYIRAMRATQRIVDGIRDDQWANATPCTDWSLRDLLNHITSENLWSEELFAGKTMAEVGDRLDGDVLGDDPRQAFRDSVKKAEAAASTPGAMERTTHLSFGDVPGSEYAKQMFADQLIHGWDVAIASNQDARLDPELVAACYPMVEPGADMGRQAGVFGPDLRTEGMNEQERLLALLGRKAP